MKEISDPIFKTDNPALLEEIKANDIRNSVLWTGKINDKNAETENNDVSKEGENNKNESSENKKEDELPEGNKIDEESKEKKDEAQEESNIDDSLNIKIDQNIPQEPIFNPNLKKVMPTPNNNVNQTQQPRDVYYHTYNNPYVFQNPVFNMMTNRQPYYSILLFT